MTTVTTTYDGLGHAISQSDPDSGISTATYDPNGNVTQTVDARGSVGTIDAGYDGLNHQLWRNGTNSPTNVLVTYNYDSTANGNHGIGQLTSENFTGSGSFSGSYAYTYDARGQQTQNVEAINGTGYTTQGSYNDAGQLLTQTYPTGETVTPGYSSTGWLTGLATSAAGTTTLASNLTYSGLAGAAGKISSMSLGNGTYTYAASYDTGMRLTSAGLSNTSSGTQLYQTQPTYDAINNVVGVQTSVGSQTDTQQFCYDDLSRMTWSGTNGTPPCTGLSITAGTLTGAQYQQSHTYNIDGGLVSGPAGSYNYGESAHPHAVTSTSNGYSATYDATGNLLCRALTTTTTCSGASPSGQQLSYDALGRLSLWQDHASAPTQTVNYLYDGSGSRVATQSTANGTTTLTSYIGSIEEVQTTGSSTQTTTYYAVGGKRVAADVNGTFYYFGYDALGSQVAVLNATGSLVGAQLYGPYGSSRYNTGTLPTSIGFTGQRADSVTGLDYYNARYYDPVVGQFLSVDSVQGNAQGMDPYAYVGGNPESRTDPTGNTCYDPSTQTVKVGCGNYKPDPPQSGGGSGGDTGSGTTTKPLHCGSGTHLVGNTCEASITSCGSGTYQQGNQCVNDANSPANKARDKRLSGLKDQAKWELVAGDLLVLAGLIFNIITNASIGPMIVFILQAVSLISNNLLGHLGDLVGNSGLLEGMLRFASVLDQAAGWLEGLAAIFTAAAWWEKNVILATVSAFKVGTLGPEQIIVTALLTAAKPVVGFLLDAGAQFLYAKASADQAEVERQTNMPLAQWCAIYQGCSAY